jgi:hypothetical protein
MKQCVFLLSVLAVAVSCTTTDFQPFPVDAVQEERSENIVVHAEYLSDGDLVERYGSRDNPFIAPPSIFREKRYMVFELTVQALDQPATFRLSDLEFSFGNTTTAPTNQFHLANDWKRKDESDGLQHVRASARQRLISSEILPNRDDMEPGDTLTGLVLFAGKYPRYGEGSLTVPVYEKTGRPLDRVTLLWEF